MNLNKNPTLKFCLLTTAFIFCMVLGEAPFVLANNLRIENVDIKDRGNANYGASYFRVVVEFDISWDNSWRDSTNHDGVWVFIQWERASDGVFFNPFLDYQRSASDSDPNTERLIDPEGTSPGTNSNLEIEIPIDAGRTADGAFLYRKSTGSGTMQSKDVQIPIVLINSLNNTDIIIHVYGIEMVNIPESPFYAGDTTSTAAFQEGSSDTDPWYLDSDETLRTANTASNSFYYQWSGVASDEFGSGTVFTIPATFPLGYREFWIMKYEITEGQWVDFYNSLGAAAQANRDITGSPGKNSTSVVKRNTIYDDGGSPAIASTSRPNRPINFISWMDVSAYLDWARLRPMTEFEYEKAGRGPLSPVAGEYAWGTTGIQHGATFSISPELGNETLTDEDANIVYNAVTFSRGDDFLGAAYVQGPARAGIFATSSSTREKAGAGYYGAMELTGSLTERIVGVGNTTALYYWPTHGDGALTAGGAANELGWLGLDTASATSSGVDTAPDGTGYIGGSWSETTAANMRLSDRTFRMEGNTGRANDYGGRGVRGYWVPDPLEDCGDATVQHPEQCDESSSGNCNLCKCDDSAGCVATTDMATSDS